MTPHQSPRVFDDENDRWIEVREGETDRDALLRARRDGAPSVLPPQGLGRSLDRPARMNRPLKILAVISVSAFGAGVLLIIVGAASLRSWSFVAETALGVSLFVGGLLVVGGFIAGVLTLAATAIITGLTGHKG